MISKLVYISGGDNFAPDEIKAALDEIRQNLGLPDDVVLFGLPTDALMEEPMVVTDDIPAPTDIPDHKVLQFPDIKKKSILNVIKRQDVGIDEIRPSPSPAQNEPIIPKNLLVVDDDDDIDTDDAPERSIAELMGEMPGMDADDTPQKSSLVDEFGDFLDKEQESKPAANAKKPKPFGRSRKGPLNLLGDLFSYAGMAANDDAEEYALPDFIKRP